MSNMLSLKEIVDDICKEFFVPPDSNQLTEDLSDHIKNIPSEYKEIGKNFCSNIHSSVSVTSMPYIMASAHADKKASERIFVAERIRSLKITESDVKHNEKLDEYRERVARANADRKIKEFHKSEEGTENLIRETHRFLKDIYADTFVKNANLNILHQGVINLVTSLEILSRDLIEAHLNLHPAVAYKIAQEQSVKKRVDIGKISLETLNEYDFDISDKMGTIIVHQQDFSDLRTIKAFLPFMLDDPGSALKELNDNDLWKAFQRRNLFVHRRGVVDSEYVTKTQEKVEVGQVLEISPDDFENTLNNVVRSASMILAGVRHDHAEEH